LGDVLTGQCGVSIREVGFELPCRILSGLSLALAKTS
jgi:hypothetical protein